MKSEGKTNPGTAPRPRFDGKGDPLSLISEVQEWKAKPSLTAPQALGSPLHDPIRFEHPRAPE